MRTIKYHWKGYILCNKNRISGAWLTTCSKFYMDSKSDKTFKKTFGTYIEFIDNTIHANLPAPDGDHVLYGLVKQY